MDLRVNVEAMSLAALRRITRATEVHSRALVREHQLTGPQLAILMEVSRQGGAPIGALAKASFIGAPTVTGIVDRLERQGLVSRVRNDVDRRQVLITLTAAGKRVLARDPSPLQAGFREQLLELPKVEQRKICEALERVASMMERAAVQTQT
jgi:DNA-binding MarR family transcriptional regulator